jgi:iron complex transport system ATP-binding protein
VIAARAVSVMRGGRAVVDGVDLDLRAGQFAVLAGPNGAGKSTLLTALAGLSPHEGRIDRPEPRARRIGFLAQQAASAWDITLAELAALGRLPHGNADPDGAVARALAACGVAELAARRLSEVSGGEARRAMLARVLATDPDLLLLDEPTAALDPAQAFAVLRLLRAQADKGRAVLAVLHDPPLAAPFATRMLVLRDGRLVADGPPAGTLAAAAEAYGVALGVVPGFTPR